MSKKWKQALHKDTDKFYTGYEYWHSEPKELTFSSEHKCQHLLLRLNGQRRGRSAANFLVEDTEGFSYLMSMSGMYALTEALIQSRVVSIDGEYFSGFFKQTKQGANYFIEVMA